MCRCELPNRAERRAQETGRISYESQPKGHRGNARRDISESETGFGGYEGDHKESRGELQLALSEVEPSNSLHIVPEADDGFRRDEEDSGGEFSHVVRQAEGSRPVRLHQEVGGAGSTGEGEVLSHDAGAQHDSARFAFPVLFQQQPSLTFFDRQRVPASDNLKMLLFQA